jgi:hypothetical protein
MPVAFTLRQTFGLRLRLNQPTARTGRFIRLPFAIPRFAERKIMECEARLRHSPLTFAAVMIGVQRAISLLTSTASGC